MSSFADLGVSRPVADALSKRGITAPFAVQRLVIEDVLDGHDVLVQSPTGSGKTLAFGVPLVDCIEADDRRAAALILAPTRELALQIVERAARRSPPPGRSRSPPSTAASGSRSRPSAPPAPTSSSPPPAGSRTCSSAAPSPSSDVRVLVIDEADRMLDMGFKPAVDRIVAADAQRSPDAVLLGHARGGGRQGRPRLHPRAAPPRPRAGRGRPGRGLAPLRPPRPRRQGRRPRRRARATPTAAARSSSSAPSTAPTAWSSACSSEQRRRGRDARQQDARTSATGRWRSSPRARSTPSSPPTSPPAGSTSRTSPT